MQENSEQGNFIGETWWNMMKRLKYLTAYIVRYLKWFQNWITEKLINLGERTQELTKISSQLKVNDSYIRREKAEEENWFLSTPRWLMKG